jgi:hypothetical protein
MLSGLPNAFGLVGHSAGLTLSRAGSVLSLACKVVQIRVLLQGGKRLWSFILGTRDLELLIAFDSDLQSLIQKYKRLQAEKPLYGGLRLAREHVGD